MLLCKSLSNSSSCSQVTPHDCASITFQFTYKHYVAGHVSGPHDDLTPRALYLYSLHVYNYYMCLCSAFKEKHVGNNQVCTMSVLWLVSIN